MRRFIAALALLTLPVHAQSGEVAYTPKGLAKGAAFLTITKAANGNFAVSFDRSKLIQFGRSEEIITGGHRVTLRKYELDYYLKPEQAAKSEGLKTLAIETMYPYTVWSGHTTGGNAGLILVQQRTPSTFLLLIFTRHPNSRKGDEFFFNPQ